MAKYDNIPNELKQLDNWVCFKLLDKGDGKKPTKVPINAKTGKAAASNDKATWCSFDVAVKACKKHNHSGIGFMFDGGGVVGIDIDHCIDSEGNFNEVATKLLSLTNSYAEYSPSKTGIHILVKGSLDKAIKHNGSGVEIYSIGRYFTVTGDVITARTAFESGQDLIDYIVDVYGKPAPKPLQASQSKPIAAKEKINLPNANLIYNEIIELAKNAKNGVEFATLLSGNWQSKYSSQSEADMALCSSLAFWCGKDSFQMDSIFRGSGLMRDKWDKRHHADGSTYGEETIRKSVQDCSQVYNPPTEKKQRKAKSPSAIMIIENCYVKCNSNGESKEITNFIIVPKETLIMDDGGLLCVMLINKNGTSLNKQFQMKDFCSVQSFKKVLNINSLDFSFKGTETDIELIKEYISQQDYPTKQGYKGIGIYWKDSLKTDDSVYVGESCTINKFNTICDNIVSVPRTQTLKSTIEKHDTITRYELEQVGKLLMSYNEHSKTAMVLCWCAACFVKAKLWDRGIKFPILIMIGEAGSGKSTTYEKVIAPLFSTEVSFGASRMTQFTIIQTASSSNCIPFAIDEYKPSTMDKFKLDLINNFLRDSYDCHEATRGNVDMTVRSYPLISPVCLIGEESPSESSIAERKIELMFSKIDIENKKDIVARLEQSKEQLGIFGKALLLTTLKEKNADLKSIFDNCLNMINSSYEERIKKNIAVCMVGLYLLDKLCKEYGTSVEIVFGISKDEFKRNIIKAVEAYTLDGGTYNKTVVDKTFEVFDRMTGVLQNDVHYKLIRNTNRIAFDIRSIYDLYTKYHREYGLKNELIDDKTFTKQLRKKKYFIGYDNAHLDGIARKCYLINYDKILECADISNILSKCGVEIAKQHTTFEQ